MRDGNLEAAEAEAGQAMGDPATAPVAQALLGSIRLQQGKHAEGIELLERALAADSNLLGARLNLAQGYELAGELDSSEEQFRAVLQRAPGNHAARMALMRAELRKGNHREAIRLAEPIEDRLSQSPRGLLQLVTGHLGAGNIGAARRLAAKWSALSGVPRDQRMEFAYALSKGGLNREAITVLERAKRDGLGSYELAFNLAGFYLLEGDLGDASANYELAVGYDDRSVPALRQVARIAEERGELEKALAYLVRAKLEVPDDADVQFSFGRVALRLDVIEDATTALARALDLRPGHRATRYWLGTARGAARQFDGALEVYQGLLDQNPSDPQLHYAVGSVYLLMVDFDRAAAHLQESLRLDPDQVLSPHYLATISQKRGDHEGAAAMFAKVISGHPRHGPSYEGLAVSQARLGLYEDARRNFETALELDPDSARASYQLGQLLVRMGLRDQAQAQLAVARQLREDEEKRLIVKTLLNPH